MLNLRHRKKHTLKGSVIPLPKKFASKQSFARAHLLEFADSLGKRNRSIKNKYNGKHAGKSPRMFHFLRRKGKTTILYEFFLVKRAFDI